MDRFIATMPADADADLMLCREHGIAYQADMTPTAHYDAAYYAKCSSYEDQEISNRINDGRIALVAKHHGPFAAVCDIGIGSGEFIKRRGNTFGFDVNPVAIEWLKRNDLWAHDLSAFGAYTFWDVIEHLQEPEAYFRHVQLHAKVFTSLPIFYGMGGIRLSKHYRPGEHLYYFEDEGFVKWMAKHGLMLLDRGDFEIDAGRESIYSYVFKRVAWPT